MKYLSVCCLCLMVNIAIGQKLSKNKYGHAVDFIDCKINEYTLKDDQLAAYKEQCSCSANTDYRKIESFLKDQKLKKNMTMAGEIQKLKSDQGGLNAEDAAAFFTGKIFNDKKHYATLAAFYEKHNKENSFPGLISEIKVGLSEIAEAADPDEQGTQKKYDPPTFYVTPDSLDRALLQLQKLQDKDNSFFKGFLVDIDVIAIVFSLLCFFIVFRLRKDSPQTFVKTTGNFQDIPEYIRTYVKTKIDEKVPETVLRKITDSSKQEYYDKQIKELREELTALRQKLDRLPAGRLTVDTLAEETKTPEVIPKDVPPQDKAETRQEVFYLSTPTQEGNFNTQSATASYREGASIYRVTRLSPDRGQFQIDEHETAVRLALQYISLRIQPCCTPVNAYDQDAKRIRVIKPGLLERQGDKWVVLEKSEISYEN